MSHRYLHVGINFLTGPLLTKELEPVMDFLAEDWVRYAGNNWIVWTSRNAQQFAESLRPYLPTQQFLVAPIDPHEVKQGYLTPMVWEWLNRTRTSNWAPPDPYVRVRGSLGLGASPPIYAGGEHYGLGGSSGKKR